MKTRFSSNNIRVSLSVLELEQLHKKHILNDVTDFGINKLNFIINTIRDLDLLTVEFDADTLNMYVPDDFVTELLTTEKESYKNEMETDGMFPLVLEFEKDFSVEN